MTTSDLLWLMRALVAYDLDFTPRVDLFGNPVDPTDADLVKVLNDAQDRLSQSCPLFDPSIPLTLTTNVGGYDLSVSAARRVMKVSDVVIAGRMLVNRRGNKPGPWSLAELEDRFPSWRTDLPGTPLRWFHASESSVVLHPAPSAATVALTNHFVSGHAFAKALDPTQPAAVSELPQELHPHLARMAAGIEAQAVATNGDQLAKINGWMADALQTAERLGSSDRRAKSPIGSTSSRFSPDYLRA